MCSLNSDRFAIMTTSLRSLFKRPKTLSMKNLFLMSNLNFPWCSFIPFPYVLPLITREELNNSCSAALLTESHRLWWVHTSAFSSPRWANKLILITFALETFNILFVLLWTHFAVLTLCHTTAHRIWCEATPVQGRVGQSLPSPVWQCCVWCTPGHNEPFVFLPQ